MSFFRGKNCIVVGWKNWIGWDLYSILKKSPLFFGEYEGGLFFIRPFLYFIILLKVLPAVNPGVFLAGILIGAPV